MLADKTLSAAAPELRRWMIQTAVCYRAKRRGLDDGNPSLDWFEAEREVDRMLEGPQGMRAYLARLDALLAEWDSRYQDFKNKPEDIKTGFSAEYSKQLQAIETRRAMIGDKLQKLRRHSREVWNEICRAAAKIAPDFEDRPIPSWKDDAR